MVPVRTEFKITILNRGEAVKICRHLPVHVLFLTYKLCKLSVTYVRYEQMQNPEVLLFMQLEKTLINLLLVSKVS